ncbi:MAG: IPT/TIG domain-containing protein [Bacteroidota bacterium]
MKTFTSKFKMIPLLMVLFLVGVTSCKKNNTPEPTPETPTANLTGKIDGKDLNISAANVSSTYYTTAGEASSSLEASAALDASGNKLNFFIDDLKNGTITIAPKLGTSSNPGNPNTRVNATGTTAAPVQTYVSYVNSGNTFYAISGSVTVVIDPAKGLTLSWSITFKEAGGRTFTSEGKFFLPFYTSNPKPKSAVVDPTPVSAKPTIDNISPTAGAAGDTVIIAGTNFSATLTENVVKFGSETASVKAATATKLTVIAPISQTSTISVKVKNSETTTGPTFTYVAPPTFASMAPQNGKAGDVLTFTGTNFSTTLTDNVVSFNGTAATVTAATATTLTVTVPANVTTGVVTLKVRGKSATLASGFTGIFTVTVTVPPTSVGTPGQSYLLNGSYSAFAKAVDNEGNLYVVDENQQLYKMNPSGEILKTFAKGDITFEAMNSYKCVAITSNKKGAIRALFYCATFPNGQAKAYIVAIGTSGTISKETQTTFLDQESAGMVWDNSNYYILTSHYNTDDIVKINGTDGTFAQYLKGGPSGDFDGNSPYSIDLDGDNNLFVLSYTKGQFSNSIPTKQSLVKYNASKVRTAVIFGSYVDGYQDGELATAKFKDVRAIAVSNQDIFVGDNGNFRVRKIATSTGQVTTIAGNGKATEPTNGNQPIYAGGLLNVNLRGSNGLLLSSSYGALYNFSSGQTGFQKFVLN